MRTRLPTSRAAFRFRVSVFDLVCAFASPLLALYFREAYILKYEFAFTVALYWAISVGFTLIAFLVFRLHDRISRYFSVHDALDVMKAAAFSQLMTTVMLFTSGGVWGFPPRGPGFNSLIWGGGLVGECQRGRVNVKSITVVM